MPKKVEEDDLVGRKFGEWTVIAKAPPKDGNRKRWTCRCSCGALLEIAPCRLTYGKTTRCRKCSAFHAHYKHGFSNAGATAEYRAWTAMKGRCYVKCHISFKRYGARGIGVCERWRNDFLTFLKDMGKRPSTKHQLDRINNQADYSPENCRWATLTEQANNKRNNIWRSAFGVSMTRGKWSTLTGIRSSRLRYLEVTHPDWSFENVIAEA